MGLVRSLPRQFAFSRVDKESSISYILCNTLHSIIDRFNIQRATFELIRLAVSPMLLALVCQIQLWAFVFALLHPEDESVPCTWITSDRTESFHYNHFSFIVCGFNHIISFGKTWQRCSDLTEGLLGSLDLTEPKDPRRSSRPPCPTAPQNSRNVREGQVQGGLRHRAGRAVLVERTCRRIPAQVGSVRGYVWQRTSGYGPLDNRYGGTWCSHDDDGLFVTMWTKPPKQCYDWD
jgi:hypothetical protein